MNPVTLHALLSYECGCSTIAQFENDARNPIRIRSSTDFFMSALYRSSSINKDWWNTPHRCGKKTECKKRAKVSNKNENTRRRLKINTKVIVSLMRLRTLITIKKVLFRFPRNAQLADRKLLKTCT